MITHIQLVKSKYSILKILSSRKTTTEKFKENTSIKVSILLIAHYRTCLTKRRIPLSVIMTKRSNEGQ